MSGQPLNPEEYEILKDSMNSDELLESSKDNEFSLLETRLSKFQTNKTPFDYADKILNNSSRQNQLIFAIRLAAILLIAVGLISLLATSVFNNKQLPDNKIKNHLNKEFASQNNQHNKKVYAFYFSSLHCKPCKDFITELDQFNQEMKKINSDFEIIFIELKNDPKFSNFNTNISFAKLNYKSLKNKAFFNQYKSKQYGPSFVVLNDQGDVIAKHNKGLYKQSFSKVLTKFTSILNKG